jgi:F0F1-type ATP synthase membrane subunit c/vacuolar-type H+-ATPase subunit K
VLRLVDRGNTRAQSTQQAGEVLRGGALIGALERGAIFAAVVAGWPEGLAVVLAIKGLARYPELRGPDQVTAAAHAVAERFIIGTFVSVLWAVTCAGLLLS